MRRATMRTKTVAARGKAVAARAVRTATLKAVPGGSASGGPAVQDAARELTPEQIERMRLVRQKIDTQLDIGGFPVEMFDEISKLMPELKRKAAIIREEKAKINPPNIQIASVMMRSLTPYVQNRMSSENRAKMKEQQEEGSAKKRTKRAKPPKDFDRVYRGSMHVSREGWYGIPCSGLRQAMIDACRLTEMDMIRAKMCIDVIADGLDRENSEPLTRITKGEPRMFVDRVRVGISQTDLAARAMFEEWEAIVRLEWDADIFTASDVMNLLARAGLQVGIGAGRKLSKNSGGTGKGKFEVLPIS